jgi:phage FluMu protein Com
MEKARCWECGTVMKVVGKDGSGDPEYKCPKCGCTHIA